MNLLQSFLIVLTFFALIFTYSMARNLLFMGVGYVLYYRGARNIGHWLVSAGFTGVFYKPMWLAEKCPKTSCDKCRRWTCPKYNPKGFKK